METDGEYLAVWVTYPKRHHYLPQAYLSGFAGAEGMIAVHDRQQGTFRLQLVRDTGLEGHLYSYILPDGSKEAPMEIMLSDIDGHFPALREGFEKRIPRFSPSEIDPLFAWVSALVLRVPRMLTFFKRAGNAAIESHLEKALETEETAQAFAAELFGTGSEVAKQSLSGIKDFLEDLEAKHPRENAALRLSVEMMEQGYRLLCNKAWITVLRAPPGKQFVTADRGALVHHPESPNGLTGYLGPGSVVLVPFSRHIALELIDGPFKISRVDLSRGELSRINTAITKSSLRFVHGDSVQRLRAVVGKARLDPFNS